VVNHEFQTVNHATRLQYDVNAPPRRVPQTTSFNFTVFHLSVVIHIQATGASEENAIVRGDTAIEIRQ